MSMNGLDMHLNTYMMNSILLNELDAGLREWGDDKCKVALAVNLNPTVIELLKRSVKDFTGSQKDYHIVMAFIESLDEFIMELYNE